MGNFNSENTEEALYSNREINPNLASTVDLDLRLYNPDSSGARFNLDDIIKVEFDENLLSSLPKVILTLEDSGKYSYLRPLKIGDIIYAKLFIGSANSDTKPPISIETKLTILSIQTDISNGIGDYHYQIICSLVNTEMFNNYVRYISYHQETSIEVLEQLYNSLGLTFYRNDISTNDRQLWLNANNSYKNFIEKVLEHSFISNSDSLIVYTTINGDVKADTLLKMSTRNPTFTFINQAYKQTLAQKNKEWNKATYIVYDSVNMGNNTGLIRNKYGYNVTTTILDTTETLNTTEFEINDSVNVKDIVSGINLLMNKRSFTSTSNDIGPAKYSSFKNFDKNEIKCDKCEYTLPNKDLNLIKNGHWLCPQCKNDNILNNKGIYPSYSRQEGVIHWPDHHDHYDVSPNINQLNYLSFFANFIQISYTVNKQDKAYLDNPSNTLNLGDCIQIYFETNSSNQDKVNDGNYIITRIQHLYAKGNTYSIVLTCVSNGLNKLNVI
jgi:hypothetical protein